MNVDLWAACKEFVRPIAIRYGLDGPEFDRRWRGRDFMDISRLVLMPNQPPVGWVPGIFHGGKATGAWH